VIRDQRFDPFGEQRTDIIGGNLSARIEPRDFFPCRNVFFARLDIGEQIRAEDVFHRVLLLDPI
jgi:hypothetical protein